MRLFVPPMHESTYFTQILEGRRDNNDRFFQCPLLMLSDSNEYDGGEFYEGWQSFDNSDALLKIECR